MRDEITRPPDVPPVETPADPAGSSESAAAGLDPSESPDVDAPAWEGTAVEDRRPKLVDPRSEVPTPAGL